MMRFFLFAVKLEENINRGKKMAKNKFNQADSVNPETIALHGGDYRSDPSTTSVAVPIYQTTSYQFHNTEHAAN